MCSSEDSEHPPNTQIQIRTVRSQRQGLVERGLPGQPPVTQEGGGRNGDYRLKVWCEQERGKQTATQAHVTDGETELRGETKSLAQSHRMWTT